VKVTVICHVIAGNLTNIQIGTPLKIVAMAANPMEIARITIDQVNILLEVTMGLGLAPSNQACAHLMVKITTSTNAVATRTNHIGMTIIQVTAEILNIPIHDHNIKAGVNIEGPNNANLIATIDSLVVMIVISGHLVTRQDPIHIIHAGRVARKGNLTIIQIGLMNIREMGQNRSYSKATTSILTKTTLLTFLHPLLQRENQILALTQPVLRREQEKLPKPKSGKVHPNRVQQALNHHNAATSGQRQKHNHSKAIMHPIRNDEFVSTPHSR